ncbi:MAG: hypothetical protein AAB316_12205 [Bacteroidota bacterium]
MKKLLVFLTLATAACLFSCLSNDEKSSSGVIRMPINPNGDTELALLMRDMFEDGMKVKSQIQNGEKPTILVDFENIHTAEATEPEKAASPEFKAYALAYSQAVKTLKECEQAQAKEAYSNMVGVCMSCHEAMCPGPIVRIKKMML